MLGSRVGTWGHTQCSRAVCYCYCLVLLVQFFHMGDLASRRELRSVASLVVNVLLLLLKDSELLEGTLKLLQLHTTALLVINLHLGHA